MTLEELLAGRRGRWVIECILRDLKRQRRELGYAPPHWAREVLTAIDHAAEAGDTRSAASGIAVATVVPEVGTWGSVREGAEMVGLSERRVRELVAAGDVTSRRIDRRTRQVELNSLKSVCARQKEAR